MSDNKNTAPAPSAVGAENSDASPAIVAAWVTVVAAQFGGSAYAKWPTPLYVLVRGDRGTGAVRTALGGKTVAAGSPWAVVCLHGTVTAWVKGQAAHRAAYNGGVARLGDKRAHGCKSCAAGAPATLPALRSALGLPPLKGATPRKGAKAPQAPAQAPQAPAPAPAPEVPAPPA